MLDTATIEELIARVEKLTGPDRGVDGDLAMLLKQVPISLYPVRSPRQRELWSEGRPGLHARTWSAPPYTRSTDAILALIEREMPTWQIEQITWEPVKGGAVVVSIGNFGAGNAYRAAFGEHRLLPVALTIALLRAKQSEMADA